MNKTFLLTFLIGLLVVGLGIWGIFYKQRGAHIEPKGSILKVRTLKLDDTNSVAVAEVRLGNDSDYALVTREIQTSATTSKGDAPGRVIVGTDCRTLFKNYPVLGEQFNPVLDMRDQVPPRSTIDREICASYTIPVEDLDRRKDLIIRIEDATGPTLEMHEKHR